MLTQVQIDADESLTVQQTCVHCATKKKKQTPQLLEDSNSNGAAKELLPCLASVCAAVHVHVRTAFAVFPPKNILALGRCGGVVGGGGGVTVHVCVHKRAPICM